MKRRDFLRTSFAASLPAWLGCAFGTKKTHTKQNLPKVDIKKSFLRAQKLGKPLLVWIVPPNPFSPREEDKYEEARSERRERGYAFGELLNSGSEDQRWPLSLCEVICVPPSEVLLLTGEFSGSPLMALIETDTTTPTAIPFDGTLPKLYSRDDFWISGIEETYEGDPKENSKENREEALTRVEQVSKERVVLLASLIKFALLPNLETTERRAAQSRLALPEHDELESKISTNDLTAKQGDQIAGIVGEVAIKNNRSRLFSLLAQAVNERLCRLPAEGSCWATTSGCGIRYEPPFDSGIAISCGMGSVPIKSQRFLAFYTEKPTTPGPSIAGFDYY